jgi:type 1 glutamine amidotransferase
MRAALVLLFASALTGSAAAQDRPKRVLFIGQAKGYQHEAITTAMVAFYNLGKKSGEWETVFRTDCTAITKKPLKWEAKNLDQFDVIVFFSDGDLDMDDSQKADFLSFIHDDGKGFIGIHSAAITFDGWPEYKQMLGGFFDGHPWGQFDAPLVVVDPAFPGMKQLEPRFTMRDEIYQIKDFQRDDVRVLLRLDRDKVDLKHQGVHPDGNDFPLMWARTYGKGRVLYNGLGHRHEVWERPDMLAMWLEQIRWTLGLVPGDATPTELAK